MTGKDVIRDKLSLFLKEDKKVHIVLVPTSRFPTGKFYNGYIRHIEEAETISFIRFDDRVEGDVRIFITDIEEVEEFYGD